MLNLNQLFINFKMFVATNAHVTVAKCCNFGCWCWRARDSSQVERVMQAGQMTWRHDSKCSLLLCE